jgi:cytochrome P450
MDNPEHARLRRMVTAPFTIRRVETMRPAVQKIVDDLIDELLAGPNPVDLVEAFALPVPSLVICELLGVPYTDHDFFQENSKVIIRRDAKPEERAAGHQALIGYLDELMGEKQERPADDLLSGLATRVNAGELTRVEAAQMGVLLLIAGHETTVNLIGNGTFGLLTHPDQLAMLRERSDLLGAAVEEFLRWDAPVQSPPVRFLSEDVEIGEVTVPAGAIVMLSLAAANRDPEQFPDPDELKIDRDTSGQVAFGYGLHFCLGAQLARIEGQEAFAALLARFPDISLAVEPEELVHRRSTLVRGLTELPVRLSPPPV